MTAVWVVLGILAMVVLGFVSLLVRLWVFQMLGM